MFLKIIKNSLFSLLMLVASDCVAESVANEGFASDLSQELLMETLTPKYEGLLDNLNGKAAKNSQKKGKNPVVVKAYSVGVEFRKPCMVHVGYYTDSIIATIMEDPTRTISPGTQVITIGTTPVSVSIQWTQEVISGISYVKHIHDTCCVYSTDFSQFVVFK